VKNQDNPAVFAKAYIAFARAPEGSEDHEANRWTFDELLFASVEDPQRAWRIIKAIIEIDTSAPVVELTAAGPLEELLVQSGPQVIDQIVADAESSNSIRDLLGGVWKSEMAEAVWSKIEAMRTRRW
jgi:hypothetical protein